MLVAIRLFIVLPALYALWYAVRVWRDPTMLYRLDWFSRATWGWLEGRDELVPIARINSLIGLGVFVVGVLMIFTL